MRRDKTIDLRQAFRNMLDEEPELHEELLEHRLLQALPQILPTISGYIGTRQIRDSVLYLQVRSSVVKHQLGMEKHRLIRQLNDYIQCELVRDIVIY